MFNILNDFVSRAENLMLGVIVVMAIGSTAITWNRTKSLTATLGALLLGAIVVFGVNSFRDLASIIGQDVEGGRNSRVTTTTLRPLPPVDRARGRAHG